MIKPLLFAFSILLSGVSLAQSDTNLIKLHLRNITKRKDTAFYRNKNYHEQGDVMEILDLGRMAKVIDGALETLKDLK